MVTIAEGARLAISAFKDLTELLAFSGVCE
jgi:hypothetical protein